jgi:hypothetical protein
VLVTAAALVVASANAFAQAKPSFAGKWTLVPPADAAAGGGGGGGRGGGRGGGGGGIGMEPTIVQDANTLTITRMGGGANPVEIKSVYKLDGSESKNMVAGGRGGRGGGADAAAAPPPPVEQISKAKWDGNKIIIVTTMAGRQGGPPTDVTMVLSLDASGNMVVETTRPGRDGGPPTTSAQTYKKG